MNKSVVWLTTVFILSFGIASTFGQDISEEARRHFDYGEAAVKIKDYEAAIKEFEQTARLAPNWPDAFYDLGLAQEGANKYGDAAKSYREYLRLAPNASDAEEVKSLINKLEYNAEREKNPTIADIVEILTSIGNEEIWVPNKDTRHFLQEHLNTIKRVDNNRIKVPRKYYESENTGAEERVIEIEGPVVVFSIYSYHLPRDWPVISEYEIEVLSKTYVKIKAYLKIEDQEGRIVDFLRKGIPHIYEFRKIR